MIRVVVPAENIADDQGHPYQEVVDWLEALDIYLIDVDCPDLDTIQFFFETEDQAMLFKLAWA